MGRRTRQRITPAGEVTWARFARYPPSFVRRPTRRGAAGQGVRYEEEAARHLQKELGEEFIHGPWMVFRNETGQRWCQPDGLWIDPVRGVITIIEIKYSHCIEAWEQLRKLYEPVVRKAFEGAPWEVRLVEFVRWYDPVIKFPGEHNLRPRLELARPGEVAIHIWNPKSRKKRGLRKGGKGG